MLECPFSPNNPTFGRARWAIFFLNVKKQREQASEAVTACRYSEMDSYQTMDAAEPVGLLKKYGKTLLCSLANFSTAYNLQSIQLAILFLKGLGHGASRAWPDTHLCASSSCWPSVTLARASRALARICARPALTLQITPRQTRPRPRSPR